MERIPEPELMNDPDQAIAYAGADFSKPHSLFIDLFKQHFPGREVTGTVLDLGCGPADITIRFANAFPGCQIDAVDGAGEMLKLARIALAREGLQGRIRLVESRLQELVLPCDNYDVIISNSFLHHLHDPALLWSCINNLVGKHRVFIMDLMRPRNRQEAEHLVLEYAAGEPEVLQQDFYSSLCAAFRPGEIEQQLADAGLGMLMTEIVSDRHVIIYGEL